MTLKEFRKAVGESPNVEFYQNLKLNLNLSHLDYKISLTGIVSIYEFILMQIEGFEKLSALPNELNEVKNVYVKVRKAIISLFNQNDTYERNWKDNFDFLSGRNPLMFLYDSPEVEFLIRTNKENPKNYPGAYEFLTGNTNRITTKDHFVGYVMAYEFTSKNFSALTERKDAEKKSISSIRSDFQNKLGEAEVQLTEYFSEASQKFVDYSGKIDELKTQRDTEFVTWFKKSTTEFDSFNSESNKKIKNLETLYTEKLKLEAPAQYWNKRAAKLRTEGRNWLIGMIACLVISIITLICILNMVADGTLQKVFAEINTAIKWSVAFIALISFLAYGIRTFAKLTFSSFHLVRDAEEREQLTYVYLALQNEKGIDQTERHLIMQSLFSRADSGLLKDDSGPTMPGNIIDQVTKR